jgi:4-amino-4-deoxy-L-arabinose transferase-like glycosyltransferase
MGVTRLAYTAWVSKAALLYGAPAVGLVSLGLALRTAMAWQAAKTLATKVLPDDAFYYLLTADRIASGHNITFDGFTLSNGYHPLWLFFLVPVYLLPGRSLPLHVALTASALMDVAAAVMVASAVKRLTDNSRAALAALALYLFLPQNIFASVNGVESSLTELLLAALLLSLVTAIRRPPHTRTRLYALIALLGGLMSLARTDSIVVVGAIMVILGLHESGPRRWRVPLGVGVGSAVVAAPWLLWNLVVFGSAVPVGAQSTTYLLRQWFLAAHPGAGFLDQLGHGLSFTRYTFLERLPDLYSPGRPFVIAALGALCFLTVYLAIFADESMLAKARRQLVVAGLPVVAVIAILVVNSAIRWSVREWYFAWGVPAAVLLGGVAAALVDDAAVQAMSAAARRTGGLLTSGQGMGVVLVLYGVAAVLTAVVFAHRASDTWRSGYFFQRDPLRAAAWLRANTPPDARVASFNAGAIGYFSERTIINIDGVVNPDAYHALREHRLLGYLRDVGVTYVADYDVAWRPWLYPSPYDWRADPAKSLWGGDPTDDFVSVAQFGQDGVWGQMRVLRFTPQAAN